MDVMLSTAADINRHHALARAKANEAIEHAIAAGRLLLAVKCQLLHGEWVPWLQLHVKVTPRQAQRYMAAAEGKHRKRAPKNDTVSHLAGHDRPVSCLPSGRTWVQLDIPDLHGALC